MGFREKAKILLVSPSLSSRQTEKLREGFLQSENVDKIDVCGLIRDVEAPPSFSYIRIGTVENSKYFGRLFSTISLFLFLWKNVSKYDIVCSWGIETTFLIAIIKRFSFKKFKFLLNIRDIHKIFTKRTFTSKLMVLLDKFTVKSADMIMVTSPLYILKYYEEILKVKNLKWIVLENKVPPELTSIVSRNDICERVEGVVIGYFGMMSYPNSLNIIKRASEKGVHFYLRGYNYLGGSFEDEIRKYRNIIYDGGYKNPEDMRDIFERCNISWAVNSDVFKKGCNDEWAMCNRFYEALYFKKPLIVQEGSAHSEFVKRYNIGVCIDTANPEKSIDALSCISINDINLWKKNLSEIREDVFILSGKEYQDVVESIIDLKK